MNKTNNTMNVAFSRLLLLLLVGVFPFFLGCAPTDIPTDTSVKAPEPSAGEAISSAPLAPPPSAPAQPAPEPPSVPVPEVPIQPTSPAEPAPTAPAEPAPATPTDPAPTAPVEPAPAPPIPTKPTPELPAEPAPVTPATPSPVSPVEPAPAPPAEPTPAPPPEPAPAPPVEAAPQPPVDGLSTLSVTKLEATRLSSSRIWLTWPDDLDPEVNTYTLKKRPASSTANDWATVAVIQSDHQATGIPVSATDVLSDTSAQQYEYVVDVEVRDPSRYQPKEGRRILASNLMICIDPGHRGGVNKIEAKDSYGYVEGDVTLRLGLMLHDTLKNVYGIDSYLTRYTDSISLGGYSDAVLDSTHLGLRGSYAAERGSDLFVSLHTNANLDNANGYPTCAQPIGINKPVLLVNIPALASQSALNVANAIGANLAQTNVRLGLATTSQFLPASLGRAETWSDARNDALDQPGAVFSRLGSSGNDYYGILRGAASVGIPGMIVEHGMHTVPEVRKAAMEGDLIAQWAAADARGIAQGFGLTARRDTP